MNLFDYLIPFLLALGALIFIHELGHYLVARQCGVKVLRFSVGFGRPLLKWRVGRDRTEWVLAAFPLGGYVKMLDEREGGEIKPEERHRAFNRQSVWRRYAIVSAGPLANFLMAIVLYWGLFVAGTDDLKPRVALTETSQTVAASAGISDGDTIVSVDGKPVQGWSELRWALLNAVLDGREVSVATRNESGQTANRRLDFSDVQVGDGQVDLIDRIGLRPWRPSIAPVVGELMSDGPAESAGLVSNDRIVAVDGNRIDSWLELVSYVRERPEQSIDVEIVRDGRSLEVSLVPEAVSEGGERIGRIGIAVAQPPDIRDELFTTVSYGPVESLTRAVTQTWDTSVLTLKMIWRMITGDVSWKNLSGPVTIADYAGQTAQLGWVHYLGFVALISISLGVLNLLPIPMLDGGHLLYYTIEIIKGSPVSERAMIIGQQIGLIALVMLMAFAFYNDLTRLFSG